MAASYPGAIKSFTQQVDLVDTIDAADVNEAYDEIEAIQTELGVNPPDVDDSVNAVAAAANLALRLDHIANILKAITGKANWYVDPAITIEQLNTDVNAAETDIDNIEADYIADTIVDAKGDLIVASAADTVIKKAVGGDNRSIRALASAGGGIEWDLRRYVELTAFDYTVDTATGDGAAYFHVPAHLAGLDLVEVHAEVITAGITGTMNIQIRNGTQVSDFLSTYLSIDSGEEGSDTAATPAVINTAQDDIAENDMIIIDIDAIHTTPAKGLIVTLGFA